MPKAQARAVLRGTMLAAAGKRRRYLFRVDRAGLLAVRVGNPLSFTGFFAVVLLFYWFLWGSLGYAALLAGGAVGMAALGVLDDVVARAVAGQPRETVLKSRMNLFVPRESLREVEIREVGRYTRLELTDRGQPVRITITRPAPPVPRELLEPFLASP